jgi:hypothetical protein
VRQDVCRPTLTRRRHEATGSSGNTPVESSGCTVSSETEFDVDVPQLSGPEQNDLDGGAEAEEIDRGVTMRWRRTKSILLFYSRINGMIQYHEGIGCFFFLFSFSTPVPRDQHDVHERRTANTALRIRYIKICVHHRAQRCTSAYLLDPIGRRAWVTRDVKTRRAPAIGS